MSRSEQNAVGLDGKLRFDPVNFEDALVKPLFEFIVDWPALIRAYRERVLGNPYAPKVYWDYAYITALVIEYYNQMAKALPGSPGEKTIQLAKAIHLLDKATFHDGETAKLPCTEWRDRWDSVVWAAIAYRGLLYIRSSRYQEHDKYL